MTTNLEIIDDALKDINVLQINDSADGEQGSFCLRRLNQMMEAAKESDFDLGWFSQSATTDTIPIPDWAEFGVTAMLAVSIAPHYGASVTQETANNANVFGQIIQRKSQVEKQTGADMSHLPAGSGRGTRHNILTGQ